MPKVFAIIVTYNGIHFLSSCINSINEKNIDLKIIVIDNGSTDGTIEFIKNKYPEIEIYPQYKNLGFGNANNIGAQIAINSKAEYLYLLNQDTISYPENIFQLIQIINEDKSLGLLSPIHLNDNATQLDKNFEDYLSVKSCPHLLSDYLLGRPIQSYYQIGFVNAAAWLIKVEVLKHTGGLFSSAFFHYGEDSNFISRLRYHGFHCGITPNVFVRHVRENRLMKSSGGFNPQRNHIKKMEIMGDINNSYFEASKRLWRFGGQQFFYGNVLSAIGLFIFPLIKMSYLRKIRNSYKQGKII
jgi:N-acetylglucosaminyl-diphospho-decaprenol L-rhamnosyltransferase